MPFPVAGVREERLVLPYRHVQQRDALFAQLEFCRDLSFYAEGMVDLSPLAAIDGIEELHLYGIEDGMNLELLLEFPNLRCLTLHGRFDDLVPAACLQKLTSLKLVGELPLDLSPIAACVGLETLHVWAERTVSCRIFGALTNLTELSFAGSDLAELSVLVDLQKLASLSVPTGVSNIEALVDFESLTVLDLWGARTASDFMTVSRLKDLRELRIDGTYHDGALPINGMRKLEVLSARHAAGRLPPLHEMPCLHTIDLFRAAMQDWGSLLEAPALKHLTLRGSLAPEGRVERALEAQGVIVCNGVELIQTRFIHPPHLWRKGDPRLDPRQDAEYFKVAGWPWASDLSDDDFFPP